MVIVWNVTDLAFLKKESGRHMCFNQSTSSKRYSCVMFSGNLSRWSFHVCAKKISAAYVIEVSSIESRPITVTWKNTMVGAPSFLGGRILSYSDRSSGSSSLNVKPVLKEEVDEVKRLFGQVFLISI